MNSLEVLTTYLFEIGKSWEEVNFYMSQSYDDRGRAIHVITDNTPLEETEVVKVVDTLSAVIDAPLIAKSILEAYNTFSNSRHTRPVLDQENLSPDHVSLNRNS